HRVSISLLLALCLIMAWMVWRKMGAGLIHLPATGGMPFGIGLDLVIAMPISWLPLAADYARFSRRPGPAAWGTWIGYFIISSGMYVLGLAAALATGSHTPEAMIMALMAETGWIAAAVLIVVLSTFTTTFLDVYSAAVSNLNLPFHLSEKKAVIIAGALGTAIALAFSAHAYEPFLLYIGSFFCPLFGVVLGDYFLTNRGRFPADWQQGWFVSGFNMAGVISWAAGFTIYRLALAQAWPFGASLPSFLAAGLLYFGLRALLRKGRSGAGLEGG
ncbi:MAG: cytosine permease, partial [Deltaproteobacteria bacterium]|nr:cytosine permease [Deltaproteobacteria bacterium]